MSESVSLVVMNDTLQWYRHVECKRDVDLSPMLYNDGSGWNWTSGTAEQDLAEWLHGKYEKF